MKKKRILSIVMVLCVLMSVLFGNVYASDLTEDVTFSQLSEDQLERLLDAGIAEEDISSLCQQIEVYNPTDIQIENYIEGLIENETNEDLLDRLPVEYEQNENGDFITPYGLIPNQDITQKWTDAPSLRAVNAVGYRVNKDDQTGVYYVVNSTAGHNQLTSDVLLPKLETVNSIDRPYQFFGMSSSNGSNTMYGDIGLVYFPPTGSAKVGQWKGFYNVVENGLRKQDYTFNFTGGSDLYFHLQVYTNKAVMIIRDNSSWREVGRVEYPFRTNCVPSNFSTTKVSKQVTLAQTGANKDNPLKINTGTKMYGAEYNRSWLYTPSRNYAFTPTYCSEAYRQGPTDAAYKKVVVDSYPWEWDYVNITF